MYGFIILILLFVFILLNTTVVHLKSIPEEYRTQLANEKYIRTLLLSSNIKKP